MHETKLETFLLHLLGAISSKVIGGGGGYKIIGGGGLATSAGYDLYQWRIQGRGVGGGGGGAGLTLGQLGA